MAEEEIGREISVREIRCRLQNPGLRGGEKGTGRSALLVLLALLALNALLEPAKKRHQLTQRNPHQDLNRGNCLGNQTQCDQKCDT